MSDAKKTYGIDVSHWQGTIDFKKVAKVCDFVIIKAGGSDAGFYTDKKFERNFEKAKEAGLSVGAYSLPITDSVTLKFPARPILR